MPHQISSVDDTSQLAHYEMLDEIHDFADDNGWDILRYETGSTDHELIMAGPGYTGPDGDVPVYVGVKSYHSVSSDYYNLQFAVFTGYVSANTFETQPGIRRSGVPAHNQHIDYWMTINDRRLAIAMKVGTPVYESAYVGYFMPYATPRQYPYPVVCAGMLSAAAATRYSDTSHTMGYRGNAAALGMRNTAGAWVNAYCWPWGNTSLMAGGTSNYSIRPSGTTYPLVPVVLHDNSANVFGEIEGIYAITGFDNAVENTLSISGDDYVVIQDVARTGFIDYYAMKLDPNP